MVKLSLHHLLLAGIGTLMTLFTSYFAWRRGFYSDRVSKLEFDCPTIFLRHVFTAFFIILGTSILISAGVHYGLGLFEETSPLSKQAIKGMIAIGTMTASAVCFFIYIFKILTSEQRFAILGTKAYEQERWIPDCCTGVLTWFLCYPAVLAIGNFVIAAALLFFEKEQIDQVAVRQVKESMAIPSLFGVLVIFIACIVPILEEILFRGFLQSWLRQQMGRNFAIALTSLIFALFHFAQSQGMANLELIASLFVLSCYLGYLFERQQSIIAPISLHAAFNSISILMIVFNS